MKTLRLLLVMLLLGAFPSRGFIRKGVPLSVPFCIRFVDVCAIGGLAFLETSLILLGEGPGLWFESCSRSQAAWGVEKPQG
jgi:hypothetical protein